MPRICHFELPVEDPERASRFYSQVFGWTIQKWDGPMEYWLVTTGPDDAPGINGGLLRQSPDFPEKTPVNHIDVPSMEEYVTKIEAAGGCVVAPKMAIPGVGYLAYCKDTEGILFGIFQEDHEAQ